MKHQLRAFAVATALAGAANAAAPPSHSGVIVQDKDRAITVRYSPGPGQVVISADLPKAWGLEVNVDGDQDGHWGLGPYDASDKVNGPTRDLSFGQDQDGYFCSQYIYSWDPEAPDRHYLSSQCGGFPSKGSIELTAPDAQGRINEKLKIPLAELFGPQADAHLQVCVWDQHHWSCNFSPAAPFVLRATDVGAPARR